MNFGGSESSDADGKPTDLTTYTAAFERLRHWPLWTGNALEEMRYEG
jgi:hypothetical protein